MTHKWALLAAGGILGTWARYGMSLAVQSAWTTRFPQGTMAVNLLGCFLAGLCFALAESRSVVSPAAYLFLLTGFCGAFTTFSALVLDSHLLAREGRHAMAFLNVLLAAGGGYLFLQLGLRLGEKV